MTHEFNKTLTRDAPYKLTCAGKPSAETFKYGGSLITRHRAKPSSPYTRDEYRLKSRFKLFNVFPSIIPYGV